MLNNDLHRLLRRQLRKSNLDENDPKIRDFLRSVNQAYLSSDKDLMRMENILEESSRELFNANQKLKLESASTKAKLENIVNSVQGVLFQTNMQGEFVYLNQAWEKLTGLKVKDSLGKKYSTLLIGENAKEKRKIELFLSRKRKTYKTIFKYHTPKNDIKWIEINLVPSKNAENIVIGAIGIMNDITVMKEAELKLNQANKTKDEFLSMMSHEIRTPLNAVIGLSNVLLMDDYLPEQLENLKALKYSGEHLLLLINDILDLNKIESNKVEFEKRKFNLNEFLRTIKYHFKLAAKEKNLEFRIEKDINVPNMLIGDSLKLSQVVKNLLSNAFKFTEEGSVILHVEYLGRHLNMHSLSFKVSDTGIGIPLDKQSQIFEKFTQARKSTSRLYGGTGLGLAISKKLLKLQNSDLHVVSEPSKGSTFWFNLSFGVAKSSKKNAHRKEQTSAVFPVNIKVLVAEDNDINTLVLKKMLDKWNIDYVMTKNGKALLEIYDEQDFDIILMDLQMPVMDGYQTTETIRNMQNPIKANIPIIALSAFSQDEIKEKTRAYKMDGYMTKPFNPKELYKLLSFYSDDQKNRLIG